MSHNPIQDGKPPDRVNEVVYVQQTILEIEEIELMKLRNVGHLCYEVDTRHNALPSALGLLYCTY
jgi:hypothetical protein